MNVDLDATSPDFTTQAPAGEPARDPSQTAAGPAAHLPVGVKPDRHGTLRGEGGRLVKGHGGVPGSGRPKGLAARVRELVDFDKAIEVLADIAYGKLAPAARIADRLKAIEILCDRGHGKAVQTIDVKGDDVGAIGEVKNLPLDRLFAMRDTLRAIQARPETRQLTDVIDAELVDEPDAAPTAPAPVIARDAVVTRQHTFTGSSNIVRATVDTAGILCVWFTSGKMYRYAGFTEAKFGQWLEAPSAGAWFSKVIKPNHRTV